MFWLILLTIRHKLLEINSSRWRVLSCHVVPQHCLQKYIRFLNQSWCLIQNNWKNCVAWICKSLCLWRGNNNWVCSWKNHSCSRLRTLQRAGLINDWNMNLSIKFVLISIIQIYIHLYIYIYIFYIQNNLKKFYIKNSYYITSHI